MFVVSLNYKVDLAEIDRLIPAHTIFLEACYANGLFIASGPKEPRSGGVILAQAASLDVLNQVLKKDPFYIAGVAEYEVTEFMPSKTAAGFEKLMD